MTLKEHIIGKFTSGRWIMSVEFTTTYCLCIIGSLVMTIMKIITVEVFLAIFAGFTPMVILINEWYYKREDRAKEDGGLK